MVSAHRGWGTQRANPWAPATQRLCPSRLREPAPSGPRLGPLMRSVQPTVRAGDQAPREPTLGPLWHSAVWKGMVGQAREGTSGKTGVGRTKDEGAVMVQRNSLGTRCGAGHLGLTHAETQRGRLWTA